MRFGIDNFESNLEMGNVVSSKKKGKHISIQYDFGKYIAKIVTEDTVTDFSRKQIIFQKNKELLSILPDFVMPSVRDTGNKDLNLALKKDFKKSMNMLLRWDGGESAYWEHRMLEMISMKFIQYCIEESNPDYYCNIDLTSVREDLLMGADFLLYLTHKTTGENILMPMDLKVRAQLHRNKEMREMGISDTPFDYYVRPGHPKAKVIRKTRVIWMHKNLFHQLVSDYFKIFNELTDYGKKTPTKSLVNRIENPQLYSKLKNKYKSIKWNIDDWIKDFEDNR